MASAAVAFRTLWAPARRDSNRLIEEREGRPVGRERHLGGRQFAAGTVAHDPSLPAAQPRDELIGARIVGGGQQQAPAEGRIGAHAAHEALEGVHHRRRIGEVIGMVHLDVRDDRPGRVVVEEVVAELVGLDDERPPITRTDRCAPRTDEGPDLDGRVQPGFDEQVAEEGGRRRLSVRAGHADADPPRCGHQLAEQRLPGLHGDARSLGGGELGVVRHGAQRRGDRHPIDAGEMRRIVAGLPADAGGVERRRVRRGRVGVAAVDDRAGPLQQERGAGRPRSGDADDVDPLAGPDHAGGSEATRVASSSAASAEARLLPSRSCGQVWRSTTAGPSRSAAAT